MGNCCETERSQTPKSEPPSSSATTKPPTQRNPFSYQTYASAPLAPSPVLPRRRKNPLFSLPSDQPPSQQITREQAEVPPDRTKKTEAHRMLKLRTSLSVLFYQIRELQNDQRSVVYLMEHKKTRRQVVIKKIAKRRDKQAEVTANQELSAGNRIDHLNVLKIAEVYHDGGSVYLVSEAMLSDRMLDFTATQNFNQDRALRIVYQVLTALKYCHSRQISHLHLSPSTLIVHHGATNSNIFVKITGFGLQIKPQDLGKSALFAAPEVLAGGEVSEKADIWSCGVLLYYLLSKELPFRDIEEVRQKKPDFPTVFGEKTGVNARILISKMLTADPSNRPAASECMSDPCFHSPTYSSTVATDFICPSLDSLRSAVPVGDLTEAIIWYVSSYVMSPGQIKSVIADFKAVDTDENGEISLSELTEAYAKIISDRSEAEKVAEQVMRTIDKDQKGSIEYSEFLLGLTDLRTLLTSENLRIVYTALCDSVGTQLKLRDLQVHIRGRSEERTNVLWQRVWEKQGFLSEKRLGLDEFVRLMVKSDFDSLV